MSRTVYRIATDAKAYLANDMSGAGAKRAGGRWNRQDTAVVYASETRSLACLETLVHLNAGGLPMNRYLVEVAIPGDIWDAREERNAASLPVGWDAEPASLTSIEFGTGWLESARTAVLVIPSAIVPEEMNVLINPAHPASASIGARKVRRWTYDPRIAKAS
ncbi:RES family NAD+ phosphorylase [Lichenicola sp.]|uniref:RES family NAD+ phosphorylase n=1 Tax=Lichenicola sp. TaxID=2804529 RepID=UPI003AFFADB0